MFVPMFFLHSFAWDLRWRLLVTFASGMRFYDTGIYGAVVQGMVSLVLLVLGVLEGKKT